MKKYKTQNRSQKNSHSFVPVRQRKGGGDELGTRWLGRRGRGRPEK
jgi:hypothetical protein